MRLAVLLLAACGHAPATNDASIGDAHAAYLHATALLPATEMAGQAFGAHVAVSGEGATIAISQPDIAQLGFLPDGQVLAYTRTDGSWEPHGIAASFSHPGDEFGGAISLDATGDMLIVGAPGESSSATGVGGGIDSNAPSSGAAYVFARSGNDWGEVAYLKASSIDPFARFGNSVAISGDGNTVAVGVANEHAGDDSGDVQAGAVYTFTTNGTAWVPDAYLKADDAMSGAYFGTSVALSADGTTLVVGAPGADGAAYLFERGTSWTQTARLAIPATTSAFGTSVAISGLTSTIVVGAPSEQALTGAAYVFQGDGTMQARLAAPQPMENDQFGAAVAISRTGAVIAASDGGDDATADDSGAVMTFAPSGEPLAVVKSPVPIANEHFGVPALSSDGSYLVIGVGNSDSNSGVVYVYY